MGRSTYLGRTYLGWTYLEPGEDIPGEKLPGETYLERTYQREDILGWGGPGENLRRTLGQGSIPMAKDIFNKAKCQRP